MKDRLVLWGASGHALVVADIVRQQGRYEVAGFLDDLRPERRGAAFCGGTILGGREQFPELVRRGVRTMVVAVGDCAARLTLAAAAGAAGFRLVAAVHPRAVIAEGVPIGAGSVVCAGVVVNPGATIGANVILNTGATVDHECVIQDGVHLGPGVHLGGKVTVGRAAWLGIGALVKDYVTIGPSTIVGAGAAVLEDLPASVVAYGIPAKVVRRLAPA